MNTFGNLTWKVCVQVKNCSSSRSIDRIVLKFMQYIRFQGKRSATASFKTLHEIRCGKFVRPGEQRTINSDEERIRVPELCGLMLPSTLPLSAIITIEYFLSVVCCSSGLFASNLLITIPLVIGSIPIGQQSQDTQPAQPAAGDQFVAPVLAIKSE